MLPCTALAVKKMIEAEGVETYGKTAVVIGRSHNVGLPIAIILGADKLKGRYINCT
jgi:methylenetetrahydrofolate dehydrogenase(NAD+)/5,10-methenyltetrahydrofolate cyclohydrolase